MAESQVINISQGAATSAASSSKLFSIVLNFGDDTAQLERICPLDEICIITNALDSYCAAQQSNKPWQKLLEEENPRKTESPSWNAFLGPIFAFKLVTVLSGTASLEGKIPWSVMSKEMTAGLRRLAKVVTEDKGWPGIFEEAIGALWNLPPNPTLYRPMETQSSYQDVPQKVAASVIWNLRHLSTTFQSKSVANIIQNIQLAAGYLNIITLGVVDIPMDKDFPLILDQCLKKTITCSIVTSRFGRQYYLSFLMSLGDIKPASLREIESIIWSNLFLVARNQLSAEDMMKRVLHRIVTPEVLDSFCEDKHKLRDHFKEKYDPIRDHTSFFFPEFAAIIEQGAKSLNASASDRSPLTGKTQASGISSEQPHSPHVPSPSNPISSPTPLDAPSNVPTDPMLVDDEGADGVAPTAITNANLTKSDLPSRVPQPMSGQDPFPARSSAEVPGSPISHISSSPAPNPHRHSNKESRTDLTPSDDDPEPEQPRRNLRASVRLRLPKPSPAKNRRRSLSPTTSRKRQKRSNGRTTVQKVNTLNKEMESGNEEEEEAETESSNEEEERDDKEVETESSDEEEGLDNDGGDISVGVPRFKVQGDKERRVSAPIHVYSADQTKYYEYQGQHYSPQIASDLQKLAEHVDHLREELGLHVGRPLEWLAGMTDPVATSPPWAPQQSPIYTLDYPTFLKISAKDFQDLFRAYPAIVVSGRPTRLRCDLDSLEEWGNLDELRDMHDNSRFDPENSSAVHVRASYREFLQTPKNVNSLDNPLTGGVTAPVQLATDLRAAVSVYEGFPTHVPVRVMTWGLLAKAHAVHPPHINRPGTATFIAIEDGFKKWDLGFPPLERAEEEAATPSAYALDMIHNRNYTRGWEWYSVLLHPGTMLFMRPGTVHSVTIMKDSIAVGGHFFSIATMKYSIYSIFHTFVGSNSITNVPMDSEQQMLLRILLFWHQTLCVDKTIPHIPNVCLFEDFLNLVMLLNYGELVLVVTPWRYDSPSLVSFKQVMYQLPRQRSREIRSWMVNNFKLTLDPPRFDGYTDDERLEALLLKSLVDQAHTLWYSIKTRNILGVVGPNSSRQGQDKEITAAQVLAAIHEDLSGFPGFSLGGDELKKPPPMSYSWPAPPTSSRYVLQMKK